jgi:hypothetical protein
LSWVAFALVVVGLLWGVSIHWEAIRNEMVFDPVRSVGAVALNAGGLVLVAASWALLHAPSDRLRHLRRFLIIQPAKHIPGGVAQLFGQVILTRDLNRSSSASIVAVGVHAFAMVVGASLVAATAFVMDASWGLAAISLSAGYLVWSFVWLALRRVRRQGPTREGRWPRWLTVEHELLPSIRRFGASAALAALGLVGLAAAFLLLSDGISTSPAGLVGAFALAWIAGFLAIPFPGGLGVREAVVVLLIAGSAVAGVVLAAALLQRATQVVAEVGLAIVSGSVEGYPRSNMRSPTT